ncbi:hypothetical protein [Intestinibacter sp.]
MTREEQIKNEATNYGYKVAAGSPKRGYISEAFKQGAKWGDRSYSIL